MMRVVWKPGRDITKKKKEILQKRERKRSPRPPKARVRLDQEREESRPSHVGKKSLECGVRGSHRRKRFRQKK